MPQDIIAFGERKCSPVDGHYYCQPRRQPPDFFCCQTDGNQGMTARLLFISWLTPRGPVWLAGHAANSDLKECHHATVIPRVSYHACIDSEHQPRRGARYATRF